MEAGVIITIAGEHGSPGKQIGKAVAQKPGIPFYYREKNKTGCEIPCLCYTKQNHNCGRRGDGMDKPNRQTLHGVVAVAAVIIAAILLRNIGREISGR